MALGQHVRVKYSRVSGVSTFTVDGTVHATTLDNATGTFSLDTFGEAADPTRFPVGAALQNIIITDIPLDRQWISKLDECADGAGMGPELGAKADWLVVSTGWVGNGISS